MVAIAAFDARDVFQVNGGVAIIWPHGSETVLSVQPDGRHETRPKTKVGAWETGKPVKGGVAYQVGDYVWVVPIVEGL